MYRKKGISVHHSTIIFLVDLINCLLLLGMRWPMALLVHTVKGKTEAERATAARKKEALQVQSPKRFKQVRLVDRMAKGREAAPGARRSHYDVPTLGDVTIKWVVMPIASAASPFADWRPASRCT